MKSPSPMQRRQFLLAGAAVAVAGAFGGVPAVRAGTEGPLTAWFGPGGAKAGQGLVWKHGLNLALTGAGAPYGEVMSRGASIAADMVKASGGPEIVLKLNDHNNGDVQASLEGTRRLIEQENIQSLGVSYGAATQALFPLIASSGVTTFWSGGANPAGLGQKDLWTTMALYAVDPSTGGLAFIAKKYPNAKRLAILGMVENGLAAVDEVAPKVWPAVSGGKVAMKEIVPIGTTDFGPIIAKLKAVNVDAIFSTLFANDMGYMIKQVRGANINVPILSVDLATPSVPDIAGEAIAKECYLAVDGYFPDNPNPYNKAFVEAYKAAHGVDPDYFAANFFEATNVVWALIARTLKAGKLPGRGNLSEAIKADPSFPSVYGGSATQVGKMTFDKDHSVIKPLGVYQVGLAGKLTKVATIRKGSTEVASA